MTHVGDIHDLNGRHLFLTGGTGAVGRTLLDYLARYRQAHGDFRVSVLTRNPKAFATQHPVQASHAWLSLVAGDLATLRGLPDGTTDVIHAAADTHMGNGHAGWIDQIVGGTRTLLEAAVEARVDRVLMLSSGAIYGPQPEALPRLSENHLGAPDPLQAGSTYGQAKRVAEQLCTIFYRECGLTTVIARLFAFGSSHIPRDGRYALGSFVRDALADGDGSIRVAGDGSAVRSYLDGHDMAHSLVTAWRSGKPGEAYNVGSEEPVTILELARHVRDRLSPDRAIAILGAPGDGQRSRYVPDVTRIAALGAASRSDLNRVIDDVAGLTASHF